MCVSLSVTVHTCNHSYSEAWAGRARVMQSGLHSEFESDMDGDLSEISPQNRSEWVREEIAEWISTRLKH